MNNKIIKKLMMGFSQEQLKNYLDKDILESLLEWNSDEGVYTKSKLIEMILTIKGKSTILKDKNFRRELLKRFSKDQILDLRKYLPRKYNECNNKITYEIINSENNMDKVSKYALEPGNQAVILEVGETNKLLFSNDFTRKRITWKNQRWNCRWHQKNPRSR